MSDVWFTSDTHFGHPYLATQVRGFNTVEEHDLAIMSSWNDVVGENDRVYHLGDFCLGGWEHAKFCLNNLRGKVFLLRGNHERDAEKLQKMEPDSFVWIKDVFRLKVGEQGIWLSHYAHRSWPQAHYGYWHLFGHSHGGLADHGRSMDVGVDTASWFMPYSYEEIKERMDAKEYVQESHHRQPSK